MALKTTAELAELGRSRITNGRELLPDIDGRSVWARRLRDLLTLHLSDMGDPSLISEAERSLIRRSAVLTVELEYLEQQFALQGSATERQLLLYQTTANTLRRLLGAVGMQRRALNLTPNIRDLTSFMQGSPPARPAASGHMEPPAGVRHPVEDL